MSRCVVIVDDDRDIVTILAEALESEGFEAITFQDAGSALRYLLIRRPAVLLTDLFMPGMSGAELVNRVREIYGRAFPVIIMSASIHLSGIADLDVQAFLSKPFDLDEMLNLVSDYVHVPATAGAGCL